jgi:hypothetical protein
MLDNDVLMKKILIGNDYGIIGNILYNYRNELDDDILVRLCLKDYFNDDKRRDIMTKKIYRPLFAPQKNTQ